MKSTLLFLASVLALSAQSLTIKPEAASRIVLEMYKTGLFSGKKHVFHVERYQGTIQFDAQTPARSRVELTMEGGSMSLHDDWVSAKDQPKVKDQAFGPEGIDVAKHPTMRFVSSQIAKSGDAYAVQGTLTIRGIAKPVTVNATFKPDGSGIRIDGKGEVKLRDYGIKPPSAALGAIGTKNEMTVTFSVSGKPE